MLILALEFSTLQRSVALLEIPHDKFSILDSQFSIIASASEESRRGGSPFPLIASVLQSRQPDAMTIGLGPGSYTGIRSALAIAQGWNLAHDILAVGTSSADAIAYEAWSQGMRGAVEVAIDAQRGEIYSAGYELIAAGVLETEALQILAAPRKVGQLIGPEGDRFDPNGKRIFPTGSSALMSLCGKAVYGPPENLEPIYLREIAFVKAPVRAPQA